MKCDCKKTLIHGNLITGKKNSVKVQHSKECINRIRRELAIVTNKYLKNGKKSNT